MKLRQKANNFATMSTCFLGGRWFFVFVVALFVAQALWIALSFRYPMIYDEDYHFNLIVLFSNYLSPIITNQPPIYDYLRDVASEGSNFYHYLLSFPHRFLAHLTDGVMAQIIFLRIINIGLFAAGLFMFAKLLKEIGVRTILINVGLLFFVLLPIVPHSGAHISYDNLLFLLTPLFLLYCVRIIMNKKITWLPYASALLIGIFASLVKFTFLVIFAFAGVLVIIVIARRYGRHFFKDFGRSIAETHKKALVLIAVPLLILGFLFSYTYVLNVVRYGTPHPACSETMEEQRCLKSAVIQRNVLLAATKDQRQAKALPDFLLEWTGRMQMYAGLSGSTIESNGSAKLAAALPVTHLMIFIFSIIGTGALLLAWRSMRKNVGHYFLLATAAAYSLSVLASNISTYYRYNEAVAVQPRYLLIVLPIIMVLMVVAASTLIGRYRYVKIGLLVAVMGVYLNGAGLSTHIVQSTQAWYWQNQTVIDGNCTAQDLLRPVIKQSGPSTIPSRGCIDNYVIPQET